MSAPHPAAPRHRRRTLGDRRRRGRPASARRHPVGRLRCLLGVPSPRHVRARSREQVPRRRAQHEPFAARASMREISWICFRRERAAPKSHLAKRWRSSPWTTSARPIGRPAQRRSAMSSRPHERTASRTAGWGSSGSVGRWPSSSAQPARKERAQARAAERIDVSGGWQRPRLAATRKWPRPSPRRATTPRMRSQAGSQPARRSTARGPRVAGEALVCRLRRIGDHRRLVALVP